MRYMEAIALYKRLRELAKSKNNSDWSFRENTTANVSQVLTECGEAGLTQESVATTNAQRDVAPATPPAVLGSVSSDSEAEQETQGGKKRKLLNNLQFMLTASQNPATPPSLLEGLDEVTVSQKRLFSNTLSTNDVISNNSPISQDDVGIVGGGDPVAGHIFWKRMKPCDVNIKKFDLKRSTDRMKCVATLLEIQSVLNGPAHEIAFELGNKQLFGQDGLDQGNYHGKLRGTLPAVARAVESRARLWTEPYLVTMLRLIQLPGFTVDSASRFVSMYSTIFDPSETHESIENLDAISPLERLGLHCGLLNLVNSASRDKMENRIDIFKQGSQTTSQPVDEGQRENDGKFICRKCLVGELKRKMYARILVHTGASMATEVKKRLQKKFKFETVKLESTGESLLLTTDLGEHRFDHAEMISFHRFAGVGLDVNKDLFKVYDFMIIAGGPKSCFDYVCNFYCSENDVVDELLRTCELSRDCSVVEFMEKMLDQTKYVGSCPSSLTSSLDNATEHSFVQSGTPEKLPGKKKGDLLSRNK